MRKMTRNRTVLWYVLKKRGRMYLLIFGVIIFILYSYAHEPKKGSSDILSFIMFSAIFWGIGLVMVVGGCIKLKEYNTVIRKANIFRSVGYEIPIYYEPDNPENIVSPENVEFKLSFIIPMGIILCIIPFVLEIGGRILQNKK